MGEDGVERNSTPSVDGGNPIIKKKEIRRKRKEVIKGNQHEKQRKIKNLKNLRKE